MNILVTGNLGYIGSVLSEKLIKSNHEVTGLDIGYFEECDVNKSELEITQIKKDVRDLTENDLQGFDAVIHLAALSNDPLGELKPGVTEEINYKAAVKIAELSKRNKVSRFLYASTQSLYGISKIDDELDEYTSYKNPVTSYAKSKMLAENEILRLSDEKFTSVAFRLSTVFGPSPRLRCDIVLNNLMASAYTSGKITINSDGTPWRPIVHIEDVCLAFDAGLNAPKDDISGKVFNVGIRNGNYTVLELANEVKKLIPKSEIIINKKENKDVRTYKVSFKRILTDLNEYYVPNWNLHNGARNLLEFYKHINLDLETYTGRKCNRLKQLEYLKSIGRLNEDLRLK